MLHLSHQPHMVLFKNACDEIRKAHGEESLVPTISQMFEAYIEICTAFAEDADTRLDDLREALTLYEIFKTAFPGAPLHRLNMLEELLEIRKMAEDNAAVGEYLPPMMLPSLIQVREDAEESIHKQERQTEAITRRKAIRVVATSEDIAPV